LKTVPALPSDEAFLG